MTAATGPGPGRRLPRPVLLAGIMLGTALLVTAYWDGWRPRIPALPSVLSVMAGALAAWLLFAGAATVAAELARRHHKTLAHRAARGARSGMGAAARAAGRGGRSARGRAGAWAARRWQARQHRPLILTPAATTGRREAGQPASRRPDGKRETDADRRFFGLRGAGYTGPIDQDGNAVSPAQPHVKEGTVMTQPTAPPRPTWPAPPARPTRSARPAPQSAAPGTPVEWKALVAVTADFEPEDDGALLEWMASEVAGMTAYAEALTEVYETCVNSLGVDPVAMNAVHDTADAAADAATAMAYARQRFAAHYAEVREFAASGGLLPFDGRWIKGEGDA